MWKDLSELHVASIDSGDDTLFDKIVGGKITEAIWRIDNRSFAASSASSLGVEDDDAATVRLMRAFGVVRFADMGDPEPISYLVHNIMATGHPTVIYGGRGSLKSLITVMLSVAIASPKVDSIFGYPVDNHGPVVVYDSELNEDIFNDRARKLCTGLKIPKPRDLFYKSALGIPPKEGFDALHHFVEGVNAKAAIIDSLGFATRGSFEDYGDTRDILTDYINPMIAKGLSVLTVDHKPHGANHVFGSVTKEYHARFIFRTEDLDGSARKPGERNIQLINEKASFAEEGAKITLLTSFSEDAITIESQGAPNISEAAADTSPRVKVRRALTENPNQTTAELAENTGVSYDHLRNRVLQDMRKGGEIFKVASKGRNHEIVWGLNPHDFAASSSRTFGDGDDDAAKNMVVTPEGLHDLVGRISSASKIALDLETMPKEGWIWEVASAYRPWRKGLSGKPKAERKRDQWEKIKERVYKSHATNTDTAVPRIMSLASSSGADVTALVDLAAVSPEPLLEVLRTKTLITHNGAFDLGVLRSRYGYIHMGRVYDTQLLSTIYHYAETGDWTKYDKGMIKVPDPKKIKVDIGYGPKQKVGMTSLAFVAHKYLGVLLDKESQKSDWSKPNLSEEQLRYAMNDTTILTELLDALLEGLYAIGMADVVNLEARAFPAMVDMGLNGFPADKQVAIEMADRYRKEAQSALEKTMTLLPEPEGDGPWNLNAADDIRKILVALGVKFGSKYPKTDKTKLPSTSAGALRTIKTPKIAAEWVEAYLGYTALSKLSRDFTQQYVTLIRDDGTIKGSFDTVSTGRLSCSKPNLQQVPARGEVQSEAGMRIRDIFRAPEGQTFIIADFSQVELLIAATIAARETGQYGHMLEVFRKAEVDIHVATAASMLGKEPGQVTKPERTMAKAVNFGLIYGAQAPTLQEYAKSSYGVDMSIEEAKEYRRAFFERYPEIANWHGLVDAQCDRKEGFSHTPLGRRRKLPVWTTRRDTPAHPAAKNAPVQGAGADAIKLTMAKLFEDRENCPGNPKLRATVHDEVVISVEEDRDEKTVEWVRSHMAAAEREAVMDLGSPIVVDVEVRESWGG